MPEIIPAILPASYEDIREKLSRIQGAARAVQIDLVDGVLIPNKTWPYSELTTSNLQPTTANTELPFEDEFEFEMDLMVEHAEDTAEFWRQAGAKRIVIHIESPDAREALMAMQFEREEHKKPEGVQVGIALPSTASPDILREYENLYDYVQVMGIERIGFQGQPFDDRATGLVRALRQHFPNLVLQVDGGVGEANIRMLAEAGASRLVVGSEIWKSEDPKAEIGKLNGLANSVI